MTQNGPLYLLKKSTAISSHKGAPRCAGSCVERPLQGCRLQVDSLLRQVPAQAALNVTILAVSADKLNRFRPCLHGIFPCEHAGSRLSSVAVWTRMPSFSSLEANALALTKRSVHLKESAACGVAVPHS